MRANTILETIGRTPHIRLHRLFDARVEVWMKQERANPDIINGQRHKRIAAGAGVDVSDVNKILKMQRQMADVMKKMGKGGRAMMGALSGLNPLAGMGGMPPGFPGKR
mgnify:CR=1 FL=1